MNEHFRPVLVRALCFWLPGGGSDTGIPHGFNALQLDTLAANVDVTG